jgi:Xaa-Pro aminopeptidase
MFPSEEFTRRVEKLRRAMRREHVHAAVIINPINRLYFTGFESSSGVLLVALDEETEFYTDFRYAEMARKQLSFARTRDLASFPKRLNSLAEKGRVERAGFEGSITTDQFDHLRNNADKVKEWTKIEGLIQRLRAIKSPRERELIRQAVRLGDKVFESALSEFKSGMSEWEMRRILRFWVDRLGAEGESFDCIISVGANSSQPHAHVTDKVLRRNQPLLIDMGVRLNHYCSDMTRTVFFGKASDKMREVYEIVLAAQNKAIQAVRAGKKCRDIDAVARRHIEKAGYGPRFGHGLGHGVGLEIHEAPRLAPIAGDTILETGMVVTVEPGVYLPGIGGVRIENMVIVQKDGCEDLTGSPKQFLEIQ